MKLNFMFLADAGNIQENGMFNVLGGGMNVVRSQFFPATKHSMVLIAHVVLDPEEAKDHTPRVVRGELVDSSGNAVLPELNLAFSPHPNRLHADRPNGMTFCLRCEGVVFQSPGDYFFRLYVGQQKLGEITLEAYKGGPFR